MCTECRVGALTRRVAVLGCVPRKLLTRDPGVVLCPHFINEDTEALESWAPCLWGPKACVSHATVVVSSLNYARASSGAKCPHIHPSGVSGGRKNSPPHSCIKPIMGGWRCPQSPTGAQSRRGLRVEQGPAVSSSVAICTWSPFRPAYGSPALCPSTSTPWPPPSSRRCSRRTPLPAPPFTSC